MPDRILIAVGANLPASGYRDARAGCEAALQCLQAFGISVQMVSPWFESAPVPASDQPWFVNAVAAASTGLAPGPLLTALHAVETEFGRRRGAVNDARALDFDLLDYAGRVSPADAWPILPHPRMHLRAFVLLPLRHLWPAWHHPVTGETVDSLVAALPPGQAIRQYGDR